WRGPTDRREGRQQTDQEGGAAHHNDGDEEGIFPSDQVADAAEDQGAERAHEEAGRVGGEGGQQRCRVIARREEQRGEERRQRCVEIEVVPFEDRAEGGREEYEPLLARHAGGERDGLRKGDGRPWSTA